MIPCKNAISLADIQIAERNTVKMAKLDERIGFVGGGNMAFAIGAGLIERGKLFIHFLSSLRKKQCA